MEKEPRKLTEIYLEFLEGLTQPGFDHEVWAKGLSLREGVLWSGYMGKENEDYKKKIRKEVIDLMKPDLREKYLKVAQQYGSN
jgi:hypothetical protein